MGWAPKTGHSGIQKVIRLTGSRSKIVFKPLPTDDPTQRRPDIHTPPMSHTAKQPT